MLSNHNALKISSVGHSTSENVDVIESNQKIPNAGETEISSVQEKLSIIQDEWNMVALGFDRICLLLYIFSFFIITIAYA